MNTLKQEVLKTIQEYNMLQQGDKVLVGVSGGPDSVALLLILNELAGALKINIFIASLNHMFRKNESAKDLEFVKTLAKKLKLPVIVENIDIPKICRQQGGSKEDIARQVRYDFFVRTAVRFGINKIALGHTKDDQAETVLMRLLYGSGTVGLGGIHPVRKSGRLFVVRPLIKVSKKQLGVYLKKKHVSPRIDSSNLKNIYRRNKVRNQLLPVLEKEYNPRIKDVLSNAAENLRDDYNLLDEFLLKNLFRKNIKIDKNKCAGFDLKQYDKLHVAFKKYLIRESIRLTNLNLKNIEYRHWRNLEDFIAKRKNNSVMHLPCGCRAKIEGNRIIFYLQKNALVQRDAIGVGARHAVPLHVKILSKTPSLNAIKHDKKFKYLDFDKLSLPLKVRFRRPGDKFMPLGMDKCKKLKDYFIDEKISANKRDGVPIAVSGNKIVCIGNFQIADFAKVTPATKKAIKLFFPS